jgi:hypothetical protein
MQKRINMADFVQGRCEAAKEPEKFLHNWFKTKRKPCAICGKDKSECEFYKELVKRATFDEKGKSS